MILSTLELLKKKKKSYYKVKKKKKGLVQLQKIKIIFKKTSTRRKKLKNEKDGSRIIQWVKKPCAIL